MSPAFEPDDVLAIRPHAAPGGVVCHVVSRCNVVLAYDKAVSDDQLDDAADRHADLALDHVKACPCHAVIVLVHDGDTGQLVWAEVIS